MRQTSRALLALALTIALSAPALSPPDAARAAPERPAVRLIVCFEDGQGGAVAAERLSSQGVAAADVEFRRDDMALVRVPSGEAAGLAARLIRTRGVSAVGPDGAVEALASAVPPDDPAYVSPSFPQRAYLGPPELTDHSVHIEPVWNAGLGDGPFSLTPDRPGVTIAVLDTGVSMALLEDAGDIVGAWDYVNDDDDPTDDAAALGYHGTRVASIIRADTDNATGIAGMMHALRARMLVYKCLDSKGGGSAADSQQAMRDAADAGARVINCSFGEAAIRFGAPDFSARAVWQDTVDYCVERGALVVAASGNTAGHPALPYTPVYFPAACDGALAVGSIDVASGVRSAFSCYGPELDLVAPGRFRAEPVTGVWSVPPSGMPDTSGTGTSYATPVVSGAIGYLWSFLPDLPAREIARIATSTADGDYGPLAGFDEETGWGLLDVAAAYREMTSTIPAQSLGALVTSLPGGLEARVSWPPVAGSRVTYRYGVLGGPSYLTDSATGRLCLPGSGTHTLFVRSYAADRWGSATPATMTVTVPSGYEPIEPVRLSGSDRYRTAAAISRESFPAGSPSAVVALGTDWPDALSATPLAHAAEGPLLLARRTSLPPSTVTELWRLRPDTVYIVGGTAAIAEPVAAVIAQAAPQASIVRLAGRDRYDTARLVAHSLRSLAGPAATAVIASGATYPDAVSGAPLAAAAGWPILLTRRDSVPSPTSQALAELGIGSTVVLGGESAVSNEVAASLPGPKRIGGRTRYETSRSIAEEGYGMGVFTSATLGIATGRSFPDALAAGPFCAAQQAPVVLTDRIDAGAAGWLASRRELTDRVAVFGGPAALSHDTEIDVLLGLRAP